VGKAEIEDLARALSRQGIGVKIAKPESLPQQAFDPRRRQYRAYDLLAIARHRTGERVLVVTNCDLFSDNLNFVFGLADCPGKHAVISLFHLRMGVNKETFRRRALKEAVHELGHTLGLSHCAKSHCVMYFSNCLADTDQKASVWCAACEGKLQRAIREAPFAQTDGASRWQL
jgi:archaemetzincin